MTFVRIEVNRHEILFFSLIGPIDVRITSTVIKILVVSKRQTKEKILIKVKFGCYRKQGVL